MAFVCEGRVTSVLGIEAERQEGVKKRQIFFVNWGDVKCAAGKFHRSMEWIIMHEPLTQWKLVWVPDTWLVWVSLVLIYSLWGCMTAEGEAMETQLCCITLCMLPMSSECVDWNDRESQECVVAIRNQSSPSWLWSIKLLLSLFWEVLKDQWSMLVDFCVERCLT